MGHGYVAGGPGNAPAPSKHTHVDRVDFSNDMVQSSIRSPLPEGTNGMGAVSSQTHAYLFGGGYSPTVLSLIHI